MANKKGDRVIVQQYVSPFVGVPLLKEPWNITISPGWFSYIMAVAKANIPNECAGFGITKDDQIVWCWWDKDAYVSSGHVNASAGRAMYAAEDAGHERFNFHWHTHPTFGAFWSPTDLDEQHKLCQHEMQWFPKGNMAFIVLNGFDWITRRIWWQDGKYAFIEEGTILLHKVPFKKRVYQYKSTKFKREKKKGKHPIVYKGAWSSDNSDYDTLFFIMGVRRYDWPLLRATIISEFNDIAGMYDRIINRPDLWNAVSQKLIEKWGVPFDNMEEHDDKRILVPSRTLD